MSAAVSRPFVERLAARQRSLAAVCNGSWRAFSVSSAAAGGGNGNENDSVGTEADEEVSHDDFKPQRKAPASASQDVLEQIKEHVSSRPVVLYMKGEPQAPQCGFSYKTVLILNALGVKFESHNVLADMALREGIKRYSNWPTIPQLYVNGEFIGGSDIVESMFRSGELKQMLDEAATASTSSSKT